MMQFWGGDSVPAEQTSYSTEAAVLSDDGQRLWRWSLVGIGLVRIAFRFSIARAFGGDILKFL
jgi:hypothetical protein